ncbi:MMPL family transporter [Micrococcus luteus]|uniref:MMPL family transporter n=1 Tax=Micrococcus luteus TaxID=1270 RepID=UPI00203B6C6B|nr:MMPL family transporter [Micrococcus luteus]MCM3552999.1 MMPL family transporter [Micrococcus luteus]
MATLLYRLGLGAARRPLLVILAWVLALALAVGGFLAFGGTLSSTVTIPGTPTAQVTDRLKEEFPEASRGRGQVVFTTEDGSPLTDAQREQITALLDDVAEQPAVEGVVDPFEAQAQQDDARTRLDEGRTELADGEQRLADGRQEIEDGRAELERRAAEADAAEQRLAEAAAQLEEGQAKLDAARADLEERGLDALPAEALAPLREAEQQVAEGQEQLDAGRAELEEQAERLEAGQAKLDAQRQELEAAQAELDARWAELEAGQAELDARAEQLAAGRAELEQARDAALAEAEAAGIPAEQVTEQFADQEAQLAAAEAQLAAAQDQADAARAQLEAAQAEADAGAEQLAAAQAEADDGAARLAAGRQQLQESEAELEAGREQVAAGRQQALDAAEAELDAQQQKIDEGRAEYERSVAELEDGRAQLAAGAERLDQAEAELDAQQQKIDEGRAEYERGERTLALAEDFRTVSEDGSTAVGIVTFTTPTLDVTAEEKEAVTGALTGAEIDGVAVHPSQELKAPPSILGPGEVVGLIVAAIVLVVMLGTLVGAGLPLVNALVGVGVGTAGALAFSSVVEMISVTPVLGVMLGLAVGIDYALFIVNRHRHELRRGTDLHESIALANGTSGNAVVFAGITVIVALVGLNVTGIPFLGLMGTVGAVCVAVAVLVAVTLTPALLSLAGMRILSKKERARLADEGPASVAEGSAAVRRAGRRSTMSTPAAIASALAAVALLVLVALPVGSMRLGLPDGGSEPEGSDSQVAYELTAEKFGEGYNGPLVVTVDLPAGLDEDAAEDARLAVGEQLAGLEHAHAVVPAGFNEDRTVTMFQVLPEEGPNAVSTEELVRDLRATEPAGEASNLGVAGMTSGFIDVSEKLSDALPLYLGVVVGLSLLIMVLVFRSILVPLIATGGFVLSMFAAMGGVVAIYQWGWLGSVFGVHNPGPVLSFLPTIMIGVLFGLAMDYQLFIASGMREAYAHGLPARQAVLTGLRSGRAVVIAAAIIMISVFGGFIFAHDAMIRPMGFGLAFGVLLDAFVVRLLLMPALMHLLGEKAWWLPRWLDRIMPDVDVEGAQLERGHAPAAEAASAPAPEAGRTPAVDGGAHRA